MKGPENTLAMMTGQGPFGKLEMGGMFTVVKVREGLARNDYTDPGWYQAPPGKRSREWDGALGEPVRQKPAAGAPASPGAKPPSMNIRKPSGHTGH